MSAVTMTSSHDVIGAIIFFKNLILPLLLYYLIIFFVLLRIFFSSSIVFFDAFSFSTSSTTVKTMVQHTGDTPSLLRAAEKRYERETSAHVASAEIFPETY